MKRIVQWQKNTPTDWKGLTVQNHLGAIWQTQPHLMSKMIDNIYNVNMGRDLMSIINEFPSEEVPTNRQLEWMLQGHNDKNIPLVAVTDMDGNPFTAISQIGKNRNRFKMTFVEDWFDADHVIVGERPDKFAVRVVTHGEKAPAGSYYEYVCELVTNSLDNFITLKDLGAGTRWSIDYTLTEQTLSKRGTGTHHTSPFRLYAEMSMMRKEYEVPGNMIAEGKNSPLEFYFKGEGGAPIKVWINKLDYDFMNEFRKEQARICMFGKSNRLSDGTYYNNGLSGYEIRAGLGIREQIAPANIHYYTEFNLNTFIDYLLGLSIGKLAEDERKFKVFTGERGMVMVARAMEQSPSLGALSGNANYLNNRDLAAGLPNRYSGPLNSLSFNTGQMKRYQTVQSIDVEFIHNPAYDDEIRNKLQHPTMEGLAESYRLTIMDFGTSSGESNIVKLVPKGDDAEFGGYIRGMRDPFSPAGKSRVEGGGGSDLGMMSSRTDGYEVHRAWQGGVAVKNPLRMGEWIPSILS